MELNEYRILHSQIIEQYQLIEFHLEGLFALLEGKGNNFEELARRVENDAMGELIRKVRFLIKEYKMFDIITKEDFKILDTIRDDRNYYCHENFLENRIDNYTSHRSSSIENDLDTVTKMNIALRKAFEVIRKTQL